MLPINFRMLPSKIVYFLSYAYAGSYVPFLNVFLISIGLTVEEAGLVSGLRLVSSAVAQQIWGYLCDHSARRKLIFLILSLGTAVTIFSFPWIAEFLISLKAAVLSPDGRHVIVSCYEHSDRNFSRYENFTDALPRNGRGKETCIRDEIKWTNCSDAVKASILRTLFYGMLAVVFISNVFFIPLNSLLDYFVLNVVNSSPYPSTEYRAPYPSSHVFRQQRLVGSLSFGLATFIAGLSADHYHGSSLSEYTSIFYVFLPFALLLIPAGLVLISQTKWQTNETHQQLTTGSAKLKSLADTFGRVDNAFFMISLFIFGVANSVLLGFLFVLMQEEMEATKTVMGLAVLVSCFGQALIFPFSDQIIILLGAIPCIEIATISFVIRFLLVSYIHNAWLILPTQMFHSVGFTLFWAAAIEHTQGITPKEIYATMFSILSNIYYCMGGVVASIVGGKVCCVFSGRVLFRAIAVLCGVWFVIMVTYYHGNWLVRSKRVVQPVTPPGVEEVLEENDKRIDGVVVS